MTERQKSLYHRAKELASQNGKEALQPICDLLKENMDHYNWVGFYYMNNDKQKLEIGPYSGEETPHKTIPFGTGICGQVALSGETFVVPDVAEQDNYLACSIKTKAELVVPIYKGDVLVGQVDIDSFHTDSFTKEDEVFIAKICALVSKVL